MATPMARDASYLDLGREAWVPIVFKTPEGRLGQRDITRLIKHRAAKWSVPHRVQTES